MYFIYYEIEKSKTRSKIKYRLAFVPDNFQMRCSFKSGLVALVACFQHKSGCVKINDELAGVPRELHYRMGKKEWTPFHTGFELFLIILGKSD